ncbi:hypothetical protein Y032_0481g2270 [Ancylostoma ceylanicum]|uniref:CHCH domain-containing protein n=1 Tax=Ancylostoma ceylanicum TaxID=53326 RepID=A0A016WVU1_9BILA|nr:hypothetical protein Y032_0481g2270 [Ancylostoma ceylanicum]
MAAIITYLAVTFRIQRRRAFSTPHELCGHFFRRLYVCMSEDDNQDATVKCPEQFIDWAACMQNMSDERRMQMRTHLLEPDQKEIS